MNGYNARNIDAFLAPYAEDVELIQFPGKLIGKGKDAMRKAYTAVFNSAPDLHCEIKDRIIHGNTIIDKEIVTGIGKTKVDGISIYQIENNKIKKVYIIL